MKHIEDVLDIDSEKESKELDSQVTAVNSLEKSQPWLTLPLAIILGCSLIGLGIAFSGTREISKKQLAETMQYKSAVSVASLVEIAKKIDLKNTDAFASCVQNGDTKAQVIAQKKEAEDKGAKGTPYNILYFKDGTSIAAPGALPAENFRKIIDEKNTEITAKKSKITSLDSVYAGMYTYGDVADIEPDVVIVEYSDIDCPFCKRLHPTLKRVTDEYTGRVLWAYRHNPLDKHPDAQIKAEAVECAARIGGTDAFWQYLGEMMKE